MNSLAIAFGIAGIAALTGSFYAGIDVGSDRTNLEWQGKYLAMERLADERLAEIAYAQKKFADRAQELEIELQDQETRYEKALADLSADHARRMRSVEARSSAYSGWAEAGTNERKHLADHATRLDSSLSEGRGLVQEFRTALGQCERDLKALGQQIKMYRALIGEPK